MIFIFCMKTVNLNMLDRFLDGFQENLFFCCWQKGIFRILTFVCLSKNYLISFFFVWRLHIRMAWMRSSKGKMAIPILVNFLKDSQTFNFLLKIPFSHTFLESEEQQQLNGRIGFPKLLFAKWTRNVNAWYLRLKSW